MFLKAFLPLLSFILIATLLAFGLRNDPTVIPSPLINQKMPAFSAATLKGKRAMSNADWTGESALVNVWASWCVACREEHGMLMALHKQGVPIYGINYKDERKDALAWLVLHGDPYKESVHDLNGNIGIDWGVYGVPETFVIDTNGFIRYKHIGALTQKAIDEVIFPLLVQLEIAKPQAQPRAKPQARLGGSQ